MQRTVDISKPFCALLKFHFSNPLHMLFPNSMHLLLWCLRYCKSDYTKRPSNCDQMPSRSNASGLSTVSHIRSSTPKIRNHLPNHFVWSVTLSQAERTGKVADKQWLLLDGGKESLVDCLLVCGAAARWFLWLYKLLVLTQLTQ